MKILIVTAWYHPFIHPRAHRWTALAEHWASQGHEVQVLTSRRRDCPNRAIVNGVQVHRRGFDSLKEVFYFYFGGKQRGRVGAVPVKSGLAGRMAAWVYKIFWKNLYFPDDACIWYFPAKKMARHLMETGRFDSLITVSLPFTGHLIGRSIRRSVNGNFTWLADVGDPFSFQVKSLNNSFLYGKLSRFLERRTLESADFITVTTGFTLRKYRELFGESVVERMQVIPPLLHPAPPATGRREPAITNPTTIRLAYFGAMYSPVRTPDALLDLLDNTFKESPQWKGRLELHFYGEIFPEFYERLSVRNYVWLHGLRPRAEVQAAMLAMDALVSIGNANDFQLPSKAVDYLAAGKPVLHLSYSDDDPFTAFFNGNSMLLNLKVKKGRVGEEEVQRWLEWLEGEKKSPDEAVVREKIAPYLVQAIAGQYINLLDRPAPGE